jgi:hypothetical protein
VRRAGSFRRQVRGTRAGNGEGRDRPGEQGRPGCCQPRRSGTAVRLAMTAHLPSSQVSRAWTQLTGTGFRARARRGSEPGEQRSLSDMPAGPAPRSTTPGGNPWDRRWNDRWPDRTSRQRDLDDGVGPGLGYPECRPGPVVMPSGLLPGEGKASSPTFPSGLIRATRPSCSVSQTSPSGPAVRSLIPP